MKKLFILLLVALFGGGVFAQDVSIDDIDVFMEKQKERRTYSYEARNAIYLELFGNGICTTLNYERFIQRNMSIRIGYGTAAIYQASMPVMFNIFAGKNHRLELSVGVTFFFNREPFIRGYVFYDENITMATGVIGYRYQPLDGGFVFKIGFIPFYAFSAYEHDRKFFGWSGFSFGVSF